MTTILIERSDGGVSVMNTDDPSAAIPKWEAITGLTAVRHAEGTALPDRTFRAAWKLSGSALAVDMPKARELHIERLRALREPLLAASDIEFIRAIEANDRDKQIEVAARKQALRDVTADPSISAARTPEELKAAIPAVLRG